LLVVASMDTVTVDDQIKAQTLRDSPRGEFLIGKAIYVALMDPECKDEYEELRLMMVSLYPSYAKTLSRS